MSKRAKRIVHATLLAIGVGGCIHLLSLFIIAIQNNDLTYANPAFAVDLDKIFPTLTTAFWFFLGGWVVFGLMVAGMYYLLGKSEANK